MSSTHGSLGWSSAALLVGPVDVVVIDTGGPGYRPLWDERLRAQGLNRFDVTRVFVTHCHWDHLGGASWFPDATVHLGRDELHWATANAENDHYLEPAMLESIRNWTRLETIEAGDDVAGIVAMATPGHTPGHLSFTASTDVGPLLVVGDAIKNRAELDGADFAITMDAAASAHSRELIRSIAQEENRSLLLGHAGLYSPQFDPVDHPSARIAMLDRGAITVEAPCA